MFVTGPDVIKTVTHEDVTKEALAARPRTIQKAAWRTSARRMTPNACA